MTAPVLIPILGDQLTRTLASLKGMTKADSVILMMEVHDETTYVKHHKQKIALIFSAMRHFAQELAEAGWTVDYVRLTDSENTGSFTGEVKRAVKRHTPSRIRIVEPGEVRVQDMIDGWAEALDVEVEVLEDDRFVCSIADFTAWAQGREHLVMENFYREMRRKTGLLMDGNRPAGGEWNYDKQNRASPDAQMTPPASPRFDPDETTREVLELVADRFGEHFGTLETFAWPVTAREADESLDRFIAERLPDFGTYQDAMVTGEDTLYHSLLSAAINLGLLDPLDCCRRAEAAYHAGEAPLNAVEGFIRQIIGWREYVRGMYWLDPEGLRAANALNATRALPDFYWTGETDMHCLAESIRTTRDNAHAHHIQRLMVLGNFALLAGVRPQDVEDWFLMVYVDAFEWVELPNVAAMALWADGGRLASKPYAASGNYINTMSNYCSACRYKVSKKFGKDACPFNPLYWDFLLRHRERFATNPRLSRAFATWDRMKDDKREAYLESASRILKTLQG